MNELEKQCWCILPGEFCEYCSPPPPEDDGTSQEEYHYQARELEAHSGEQELDRDFSYRHPFGL